MNSFAYYDNLPFDYDGSHNINDIALRTKKLVSNSNDYNEFIHKFYNHTKLLTFKLPMIKTDRNINKKNIESSEFFNKNNSSALDKINDINYDRNDNHSGNTTLKYLNVEKIKNLKKFKLNFRSDSIFTELNGLSAKDYKFENTSLKFNNNMFITNDNYTKLKIINSNINIFGCNKNKNISEIQQLSGLYFNFEETGLVYDHTDIFEKKETYKNFINDNLLYGEENSNRTSILEKTFNQGNNKEITFNLHSIKIKFTNLNTDINNYFTCELPFELITTFYNFSLDNFKLLLISSIKFNTNYDEAIIDDNDLFSTAKILNQNLKSNQTDLPDYFKKGIENVYRFNWITSNQKFQVEIK